MFSLPSTLILALMIKTFKNLAKLFANIYLNFELGLVFFIIGINNTKIITNIKILNAGPKTNQSGINQRFLIKTKYPKAIKTAQKNRNKNETINCYLFHKL